MSLDTSIKLVNISKKYPGVQALKNVNFELKPGEVHCLVGENGSGKSTLIKILSGVENPEPGSKIFIDGELVTHHDSLSSLTKGIQVIYQDMSLFPNLTVRENISFRNHINKRESLVNWKNIDSIAQKALDEINIEIDLDRKVDSLSVAQQQLVEITRSLTGNLKLLILDEPTASLTRKEVNSLFKAIERLKAKGISILFVSHKLNEVFEIAEKVTILRDGEKIGEYKPSELDQNKLVYLMSGHKVIHDPPVPVKEDEEILLEVRGLSKIRNYSGISFKVKKGEILGITGLLGSGRTELALSIFGMNQPDSGDVLLEGSSLDLSSNVKVLSKGIAYVSEDRRNKGLIQEQSIEDNITITTLNQFLTGTGLIDENEMRGFAEKWTKELGVKVGQLEAPIKTLSGGNQQKVVLAKWLAVGPRLLILDEPTIGIDVVAKNSIHKMIKSLAAKGMGIILISDEVQEIIHNCHRAVVMNNGKIVYEFVPEDGIEEILLEQYNLA